MSSLYVFQRLLSQSPGRAKTKTQASRRWASCLKWKGRLVRFSPDHLDASCARTTAIGRGTVRTAPVTTTDHARRQDCCRPVSLPSSLTVFSPLFISPPSLFAADSPVLVCSTGNVLDNFTFLLLCHPNLRRRRRHCRRHRRKRGSRPREGEKEKRR